MATVEHDGPADRLHVVCSLHLRGQGLTRFLRTQRGSLLHLDLEKLAGVERILDCLDRTIGDPLFPDLENWLEVMRKRSQVCALLGSKGLDRHLSEDVANSSVLRRASAAGHGFFGVEDRYRSLITKGDTKLSCGLHRVTVQRHLLDPVNSLT